MSKAISPNYDQVFLLPPALDDWVPPQHPVRFVRDFVDLLDLRELGFRTSPGEDGRPHYSSELLLKVWLFGWMERTRSSRALERACLRDVAFMWLTGNHHPDHNTLWRFFRNNRKALRELFKKVVRIAAAAGLVGFTLHALDGTKIVAASSTEKAWQRSQLQLKLKDLDQLVEERMAAIERAEDEEKPAYPMPESMQDVTARRAEIKRALAELEQTGTACINPLEREARMMKSHGRLALSYNGQAVADHESGLIVGADLVNEEADNKQLVPMVEHTRGNTGCVADTTVADAGYYSGEQWLEAELRHLPVIVNRQREADKLGAYNKSNFTYDAERDGYICPRNEFLPYERTDKTSRKSYWSRTYRCRNGQCPVRAECSSNRRGRTVARTPYEDAVERLRKKWAEPESQVALSLRQEIIELVFAQLKSVDGFRRFTVRGLESAGAQWALLCTAFDLRKLYTYWRDGRLVLSG